VFNEAHVPTCGGMPAREDRARPKEVSRNGGSTPEGGEGGEDPPLDPNRCGIEQTN
jgi:hypothetical protein